ncbi:MAG: aminomethyltransferase family protein [Nitrospiria bacterium]
MQTLPLEHIHRQNGAHLASYGDWELPEHYGDPLREYRAVREGVGLSDLSDRGKLLLTGAERISFLQKIASNDLEGLSKERGIYSTLLSPKGKILSDFYLYALPDALLLETDASIEEKIKTHLMRYRLRTPVEITSPPLGRLLVSGPGAQAVIEKYLGVSLPVWEEKSFFQKTVGDTRLTGVFRSITGEADVHLYCPTEKLKTLWSGLYTAGELAGIRPVGQRALEILRVEAGKPQYGIDMDEMILPEEAGIHTEAVSYTKGCYPGQEVMARIKTYGHVNRHLTGLVLETDRLPEKGDPIFLDDTKVGKVTSMVSSPFMGKGVAMGYLLSKAAAPGTQVIIQMDQTQGGATVTALPFYKKKTTQNA